MDVPINDYIEKTHHNSQPTPFHFHFQASRQQRARRRVLPARGGAEAGGRLVEDEPRRLPAPRGEAGRGRGAVRGRLEADRQLGRRRRQQVDARGQREQAAQRHAQEGAPDEALRAVADLKNEFDMLRSAGIR